MTAPVPTDVSEKLLPIGSGPDLNENKNTGGTCWVGGHTHLFRLHCKLMNFRRKKIDAFEVNTFQQRITALGTTESMIQRPNPVCPSRNSIDPLNSETYIQSRSCPPLFMRFPQKNSAAGLIPLNRLNWLRRRSASGVKQRGMGEDGSRGPETHIPFVDLSPPSPTPPRILCH